MAHWVIVPAAGIGTRMGSITPKQYLPLGGQTVLGQTLHRLASLPGLARIVVALHPEDHFWPELALPAGVAVSVCEGGSQRSQSVLNALQSLQDEAGEDDWVLVHDAVRPCVRVAEIATLLCEIAGHPCGGLLAVPVSSTLKRRDEAGNVAATLPRENVWQAATPRRSEPAVCATRSKLPCCAVLRLPMRHRPWSLQGIPRAWSAAVRTTSRLLTPRTCTSRN